MRNLVIGALLAATLLGCQQPQAKSDAQTSTDAATPANSAIGGAERTLAGGLVIQDLVEGKGIAAVPGKNLSVHCTGWLTDGTKFYSTFDGNEPLKFRLGSGQVIAGWEQGIPGMKIGGKRKLTIPPALGYGEPGRGPIPPNATLVFEVELLDIQP